LLQQDRGGRILAIDLGDRRIGLALSDPLGLAAQALPTAERRNKRQDLNFLEVLTRRHGVSRVLVGNPLNMDGSAGPQSAKARAFAEDLAQRLASQRVAVELWDERLTSVAADQVLDAAGAPKIGRKGAVDQMAAAILLQDFLDTRRAELPAEETVP
jgi:putative Holliday junction resolvase